MSVAQFVFTLHVSIVAINVVFFQCSNLLHVQEFNIESRSFTNHDIHSNIFQYLSSQNCASRFTSLRRDRGMVEPWLSEKETSFIQRLHTRGNGTLQPTMPASSHACR